MQLDAMIECASIAAYDFPVLLGPMRIVSGRREMAPFLMGPKSLICMSRRRGVLTAVAASAPVAGCSTDGGLPRDLLAVLRIMLFDEVAGCMNNGLPRDLLAALCLDPCPAFIIPAWGHAQYMA